jgi:hypothetical protein
LSLGPLSAWALEGGARQIEDEHALLGLVATFQTWLASMTGAWLEAEGLPAGPHHFSHSARPVPYWPLATLMEHRLRDGAPGEPPIPMLSLEVRTRAGACLRRLAPAEVAPPSPGPAIVVLEVCGWQIACGDELAAFPFSRPWIVLRAPEEQAFCEVLRVDAWNPTCRAVVDGDAHAFRRFVDWLAAGVVAADLDLTIVFDGLSPADEGDPDAVATPSAMRLSEWLAFAVYRDGDRYLADWRFQWDIVQAGETIASSLGAIYGMSPAERERLAQHDTPRWRRFLREVVAPSRNSP